MGIFDFLRRDGKEFEKKIDDGLTSSTMPLIGTLNFGSYNDVLDYRGINKSVTRAGANNIAQIPWMPFSWEYIEQVYYNSDILRTTVQVLLNETFGNGIRVEQKFIKKCMRCGTEFDEDVDACPVCGSTKFREPNQYEREFLEKILKKANVNGQKLIHVLIDIAQNVNIFDNAFMVIRKKYEYNDDGDLIGEKFVEVFSGDPKHIYLIMSNDGRPGLTRDGKYMVFVCPEHRDNIELVDVKILMENPEYIPKCKKCGRKMLKAVALFDDGNFKYYYADGEVYHLKKFSPGIGYGWPMILTLLKKILILIKQDWFILTAYHMQRPPRGLLVLRADRNSVAKAFAAAQSEAYKNPWNIVPLVISGTEKVVSKRVVEWLDLSYKPDEVTFTGYRQEVRRAIASAWQISPIFQGEVNTGISNEGLQITITNRAVMREQNMINDMLDWFVSQLNIHDWQLRLNPNEPMDVKGKLDRISKRIDIAQKAEELGFEFQLVQGGVDGVELVFKGNIDITKRLKRDIQLWAKENGYKIDADIFIEILKILPKTGIDLDNFKRLLVLSTLVGGIDNVIKNVESQLNIPPVEQILYKIEYPDAYYNGNEEQQSNSGETFGNGNEYGGGFETNKNPFDEWLESLESEGLLGGENEEEGNSENVEESNNEESKTLLGEEKFSGQPEMNRENMPGMEYLYGRNEKE